MVIDSKDQLMEELKKVEGQNTAELERTLMIASLVNMSNFYRRAAEKLVDEIGQEEGTLD